MPHSMYSLKQANQELFMTDVAILYELTNNFGAILLLVQFVGGLDLQHL